MHPKPRKSLSQNYLFDPGILEHIVRESGIDDGDSVVEIGPGPGGLTSILLKHSRHLTAIELDKRHAHALARRFAAAMAVTVFPTPPLMEMMLMIWVFLGIQSPLLS